MKKKAHYISISESRILHFFSDGTSEMELVRQVCIQRASSRGNSCKIYSNVSERRILQLAKIQERMAK